MLCIQSHNWMLKWFGDKTNLIAGCYWTHNNVDILPSPYWLYLTLNLTLRQGLSQWPSETPFILNYSDSVKENWTHMATLFFFFRFVYYYCIYTSILPSADVYSAWLLAQKNCKAMLHDCFNTSANERRKQLKNVLVLWYSNLYSRPNL